MINPERICKFRFVRRRRNRAGHVQRLDDLGLRACSCMLCDPHKLEPNKLRRAREIHEIKRHEICLNCLQDKGECEC